MGVVAATVEDVEEIVFVEEVTVADDWILRRGKGCWIHVSRYNLSPRIIVSTGRRCWMNPNGVYGSADKDIMSTLHGPILPEGGTVPVGRPFANWWVGRSIVLQWTIVVPRRKDRTARIALHA